MLEKLYFDNSSQLLISLSTDFKIHNASKAFLELVGGSSELILGASLLSFISPAQTKELENFLSQAKSGEKHVFQWNSDGSQSKSLRFKMHLKSPLGSVLKIEDPGALNNKWGKKLVNEQILQLMLNLIPFPLFVKNRQSEYVLLNQAQADLFGLTMAEMIGKSDATYVKDDQELELVEKSDQKVFKSFKKTVISDQQFTTPNGRMYLLETIKVPFINDVTGETNILGVSIDNTEKKQAQAKLMKTHQEQDLFIQKATQDLNACLLPIVNLLGKVQLGDEHTNKEIVTSMAKITDLIKEISNHSTK